MNLIIFLQKFYFFIFEYLNIKKLNINILENIMYKKSDCNSFKIDAIFMLCDVVLII